jgi:outer membrane protein, heavy metal efflux system
MKYRILISLAILSLPLGAQSLPSLVAEALRNNREILAAQKRYEAARQRPAQAASLPDPTLSLGYTANGGPWPVAGIGSAATSNAGLMVSQEMPFPGKRKLRGEIAQSEAGAAFEQYRAVRLNVISRIEQSWHQLHHAVVGIAFVHRYQELLRHILDISQARYAVGQAAQQDIFKAQTQFSIFETELLRFEQERTTKEIEINALLNRAPDTHIDIPEDIPTGELPATLDQMLAEAHANAPSLAIERSQVQRSELAANLARKDYYPDYALSGGYFNQGSMPPMWQFRVDLKIPAWFWNKQRAAVNEQHFAASEARHTYESTGVELDARIREDYTLASTSRKLIDLYEKSVIPEARLALESSMASYETGSLDFLALFSNFMNLVDYELRDHEEIMQFHIALARLREMTGMEMKP